METMPVLFFASMEKPEARTISDYAPIQKYVLDLKNVVKPESSAKCLRIHSKGASVCEGESRRRDADGSGRDDRAPKKVANDLGWEAGGLVFG